MNAFLAAACLVVGAVIAIFVPGGAGAALFCGVLAFVAALGLRALGGEQSFLLRLFVSALLVRVAVGALINIAGAQDFFGGDAITYDNLGFGLLQYWRGDTLYGAEIDEWLRTGTGTGTGMIYLVATIYAVLGRNMLAVQLFNAVAGAATVPMVYHCARHIYGNLRVARGAALAVAFYPSLVLWSAQGLKDGPIVFLLAATMLATLRLGERFSLKAATVLLVALLSLLNLRFYVFYMVAAAIAGSFLVGMRQVTSQSLFRQVLIVVALGLALTYFGVLRRANIQFGDYANLEAVQRSRADLATSQSGFGRDADVSTTSGALSALPLGITYLLFAPFPWQLANLRQSLTLPEMVVWWCSFPLLVLGAWFTLKHRLRRALPILLFTTMLTLAYSIFQGNVGTAYRQRSQILVFYFIFVAVGAVLLKEQREARAERVALAKEAARRAGAAQVAARRYANWQRAHDREVEDMGRGISERLNP